MAPTPARQRRGPPAPATGERATNVNQRGERQKLKRKCHKAMQEASSRGLISKYPRLRLRLHPRRRDCSQQPRTPRRMLQHPPLVRSSLAISVRCSSLVRRLAGWAWWLLPAILLAHLPLAVSLSLLAPPGSLTPLFPASSPRYSIFTCRASPPLFVKLCPRDRNTESQTDKQTERRADRQSTVRVCCPR